MAWKSQRDKDKSDKKVVTLKVNTMIDAFE